MATEVLLDKKGLDSAGKSTLTLPELVRHLANARTIALLDMALTGPMTGPAQLQVRRDGTFVVLPERDCSLEKTLTSTTALLDAMTLAATNPGVAADSKLKKAELAFDKDSLKCVKRAIHDACGSEEVEFQINTGTKRITIRMPHKSTLRAPQENRTQPPIGRRGVIGEISPYIDAVSHCGQATYVTRSESTRVIKAGDKILVKITGRARKFFRLDD